MRHASGCVLPLFRAVFNLRGVDNEGVARGGEQAKLAAAKLQRSLATRHDTTKTLRLSASSPLRLFASPPVREPYSSFCFKLMFVKTNKPTNQHTIPDI